MAGLNPIKRSELVRYLKKLGFEGPYPGKRHEYVLRNGNRLILPNPYRSDISVGLLVKLLKEAEISREEWEEL
jgi:predicted RNA binding protein YcfA (HicA-like mRNA interferase family)